MAGSAQEPSDDHADQRAPRPDHASSDDAPAPHEAAGDGGDSPGRGRGRQYDDVTEEVVDTDRDLTRTAIDELRGDVHGGTVVIEVTGHRGATVRAHRTPPETLARPHIGASGFARIADMVRQQRIVVVRGPEGSGKTAALLHALSGGSSDLAILRLSPRTDLRTLAPGQFDDCHAVILEDLTEEHLGQLDEYEISRLRYELAHRWLGLTVATSLGLPPALTSAVVDIGDPPSADHVFEEHFTAAQPAGAVRTAVLSAPGIRQRIDEALAASSGLGRAADLATFLAELDAPTEELAGRLDEWLAFGVDAERLRWFRALPNLRAHCTALALAVFNGLPREVVTARADQLAERIAPTPENQKRDEAQNPFATDVGIPPTMLRATTAREAVGYVEGDVTLTVMRYTNTTYPSWVLGHVWDEFDAARPAVVGWLRSLGEDDDRLVRQRSAAAVGVLAERAFTTVFRDIIAVWATASGMRAQHSAAIALSLPATNEHLAPTVTRLVQGWTAGEDPAWHATTALLLGETTGPADLTRSLGQLEELADRGHPDVALAVATSLGEMLVSHRGALAAGVLDQVGRWMDERRSPHRRWVGHLAFLKLSHRRGDPTSVHPRDLLRTVPTLLIGAQRNEAFARDLSRTWHAGLTEQLGRAVGRSLTRWAEIVEKDPDISPVFVWMLRAAATDPRSTAIVERAARTWLPDTAPRTAAAVLQWMTGVAPHE